VAARYPNASIAYVPLRVEPGHSIAMDGRLLHRSVSDFSRTARTESASTLKAQGRTWLARWWPSWKLRWRGGSYKVNFDLHRAGGLWVWAMLFVLAWSGVAFNLGQVYRPVMAAAFEFAPSADMPVLSAPQVAPRISWMQARDQAVA
jgi:hypothetical protein